LFTITALVVGRQVRSVQNKLEWEPLGTTANNVTSYVVKPNQMYRDQIYEVQVLAVTETQYSQPSQSHKLSTKGK